MMSLGKDRGACTRAARLRAALMAALVLIPPAYTVLVLCRFHLDAPYLDQWEFVPLLAKSYVGRVTLHDLWAQHNEHRLLFPRIVMLALAHATGWDIRYELATNLVLGAGLFAVLAIQLAQTSRRAGTSLPFLALPVLSLAVFSMSQWQNWCIGWQLQEFMNVLAAAAGFCLLGRFARGWGRFAGAMALGAVATYSFANGLAYWPAGLLGILFAFDTREASAAQRRFVVWAVIGSLVWLSYLIGYQKPEYHPSLFLPFKHPVGYAGYVLAYLGTPLVGWNPHGAIAAGLVGLVGFLGTTMRVIRLGGDARARMAPFVCMGAYALAAAAITGVGRLGFGIDQAMSSRYVTMAQLLWVSDLALAMAVWRPSPRRWGFAAALVIAGLVLSANSAYGTLKWTERYRHRMPAQAELVKGDDPELLSRLHPEPQLVLNRREVLRELELSVFKGAPRKGFTDRP